MNLQLNTDEARDIYKEERNRAKVHDELVKKH